VPNGSGANGVDSAARLAFSTSIAASAASLSSRSYEAIFVVIVTVVMIDSPLVFL